MFGKLILLANKLDNLGLYKEADLLDIILTKWASKNSLIRALKEDNPSAARQALVGVSGDDLGLTPKQFKDLINYIDSAANVQNSLKGFDWNEQMNDARKMLGIGKNIKITDPDEDKIDTSKINPFTMKPWWGDDELNWDELDILWRLGARHKDRNADMMKLIGDSLTKGKLRLEDAYPYFQLEDLVWSIEDDLKNKRLPLSPMIDEEELRNKLSKIYEKVNKVYEEKYPDKTPF